MRLDLYLKVVAFTSLFIFSHQALAEQEISVKLKTLAVEQEQEKGGDELYISVTEYPKNGTPTHYQVPTFPTHWLSKYLSNVKDVVIWKKTGSQCEPADLLITLVEEDLVPWNMDDSLGSVQLKVECVNGRAVEKWSVPEDKTTSVSNDGKVFTFSGQGAKYKAEFKVEESKVTKPK